MYHNENNRPEHSPEAAEAYDHILDSLRERLDNTGSYSWNYLKEQIEEAANAEAEQNSVSDDEMEEIKAYITRDMAQFGYYLHQTGSSVASWLHFDLNSLENTVMQRLLDLGDRTRVEIELLNEQIDQQAGSYVAGEITGPGTLECLGCNEHQSLHQSGVILPCETCGGVLFQRLSAPPQSGTGE